MSQVEKDLQPVYKAMIKTTYVPVIRKCIILLLMQDVNRMQRGAKMTDEWFLNVLHSHDGKLAIRRCLEIIVWKREDTIQEMLFQYGLHTNQEMVSFYHQWFDYYFKKIAKFVEKLIIKGRYDLLEKMAGIT